MKLPGRALCDERSAMGKGPEAISLMGELECWLQAEHQVLPPKRTGGAYLLREGVGGGRDQSRNLKAGQGRGRRGGLLTVDLDELGQVGEEPGQLLPGQ